MERAAQVLGEPRCKGSPGGAVACIQQRLESRQEAVNLYCARGAHHDRTAKRATAQCSCSMSTPLH